MDAKGLPDYAELFCLTNFSFLRGASHAEELVASAAQLAYAALAITDECSLAGVVRAHAQANWAGLPLIIGAHFHLYIITRIATVLQLVKFTKLECPKKSGYLNRPIY